MDQDLSPQPNPSLVEPSLPTLDLSRNGSDAAQQTTAPPATGDPARKASGRSRAVAELVVTVAVAGLLALLIQALLVKPYKIPSGSMIPTLMIGQRILVDRLATHPTLGEVVVFHPPKGALVGADGVCGNPNQGYGHPQPCDRDSGGASSQTYVKRVVGLPGDHLRIVDGYVYLNGKRENFGYHPKADAHINGFVACSPAESSYCNFPKAITVPKGYYYMMGNNRGVSDDSRYWGPVPQSSIIGTAFFTYWPLSRIGTL